MERRQGGAGISQENGTDLCDKCRRSHCFRKTDTVIAGIRLCQRCKFTACLPVKIAAVHNHTADGSAVTANKFGSRVYYDICPVLDGAHQIRCGKGVVDDKRYFIFMGYARQFLNIHHIRIGVAQCLNIQRLGVFPDRSPHFVFVKRIYKISGDPIIRKRMGQQVIGSSINIFCGHNMVSCLG